MAIDVFLKIDGIEGESQDVKHKGEIDVLSFSWGLLNPERGRARLQDLQVAKVFDASSPLIFDAVCSGERIKSASLTVRKAGGEQQDYFKIVMEDVLITSQQSAGDSGGTLGVEQLALSFDRVEVSYRPQDPKGGGVGDWISSSCSPRSRDR